MKIKVFLIISTLCLISNIHSVAQQTFYVYRNDGIINQYVIADINSIEIKTAEGTENGYVQEIHTADSILRIPLALIDSVSFSAPDPIKSISKAYVDIDWTKSELLSCDPVLGQYSLSCNETDPEIKEASVVVLESDTASYVVLVTEVNKNGNVYDIKGELGDISYLFYDTEFTLTTEKEASDSSRKQKFFVRSTETNNIEFENDGTMRATGTLWSNNGKEQTNDLYKKGNTHAYTKSKFGLNLDYEVKVRVGDKETVEIAGKKFFKAKNVYMDANIKGMMDAYYDFYLDIEKEETEIKLVPDGTDKYAILKHKLFPTIPIKFMIGPVPVIIDLGADLYADVSLKAEGEFHFTEGFVANATALIGAKYNGQDENNITMYNEKPTLTITPHDPTVSGKGKISGKAHLFPRVHAWLYGIAGLSFDIKPYLRVDLSGGFQQDLLQDAPSDYCAWFLETFCGLDLAVGLSRSRLNYEVWNKSTKDYTVYEYNLYKSPDDVQLLSASPDAIEKGKVTNVKFEVYDKGFDGKNVLTPLPQLVKFEGNGEIESNIGKYGIAASGVATASWTPNSASDTLCARLYDIDGNVISEAQYFKTVPLLQFKELKQDYTTYADGNVTVSMKAVIETSSDQNADLSSNKNYGIYVKNNITGREDYYSIQENGSTDFYITLDIPKENFDVDYNSFIATCDKFLFAIYTTDKEGKISLYDEREPQIIYDEKPKSITDDIVSVESTSAVINCKYENFGFWDAVCGLEYTSDSKTENLIVFPSDENMQEIHLTDLTPNTKYQYCAYFEVNGTKEYDVYKSFTTDAQPEAITGYHSNETTTTSTIECTYKDVPENADCGYYISKSYYDNASQDGLLSGGVEWNKVSIGRYEGLKIIELSDLMPDEEYQYYAYISIGDEDVATGNVNSFNTKKPSANVLGNVQIDTNSATISYGFENVPEGGICQLILLKVGDAVENAQYISVSNTANGNYTFTGLEASTSYEYMARVEYKSRKWDSSTGSFTTKTPPSPIAITGDYSNVTKNSATVSCTYENVPGGGVCGVEYTWSGGSSKQSAGNSNGTQSITLSGLDPGTSYSYRAYIEANGQTYYGGKKSFKTDEVIPDLTGTWTCMEYRVKDGTFMETSTITLGADGSAISEFVDGTPWFHTGKGKWTAKGDGTVNIDVSFSTETTFIIKGIKGTVDNIDNPTVIKGSAIRSTSHILGGYSDYQCTFVMTKQ